MLAEARRFIVGVQAAIISNSIHMGNIVEGVVVLTRDLSRSEPTLKAIKSSITCLGIAPIFWNPSLCGLGDQDLMRLVIASSLRQVLSFVD